MAFLLLLLTGIAGANELPLFRDRNLTTPLVQPATCLQKTCAAARVPFSKLLPIRTLTEAERLAFNPARVLCKRAGGALDTVYSRDRDEVSICEFKDRSHYLAWAPFEEQ